LGSAVADHRRTPRGPARAATGCGPPLPAATVPAAGPEPPTGAAMPHSRTRPEAAPPRAARRTPGTARCPRSRRGTAGASPAQRAVLPAPRGAGQGDAITVRGGRIGAEPWRDPVADDHVGEAATGDGGPPGRGEEARTVHRCSAAPARWS